MYIAHALVRSMQCTGVVPAVEVLVEEVVVSLLISPNTAVTLTIQLLPGIREEMV